MLALTLSESGGLERRRDYPEPTAKPGEVKIRVRLAGVCATDLELVRGYMGFAGVIGHEFVGQVVAGAPELVGRRVVGEINCPCRACALCRRGLTLHCPQRTVLGIAGRDGALAEYLTLPAENCHVVPDGVPDEEAVFVEPLAAAAHVLDALRDAGLANAAGALRPDARIAVLGTGRLGLLTAQVLGTQSTQVDVLGRNPRTLAMCQSWGLRASTLEAALADASCRAAYDAVVECTGVPAGWDAALALVRPRGTIVLKSTYAERPALDLAPLVIHEIAVVGSRCGDFPRALALLAAGRVRVRELITADLPLDRGVEALDLAGRGDQIKVVVRP